MAFAPLTQYRKQLHHAIIGPPCAGSVTRGDGPCADILIYRQIRKEPSAFQYLRNAALYNLCGIETVNTLAVKKNGATHDAGFVDREQPGNCSHNGCFTCAIRAEERDHSLIWYL